MDWTWRYMQLCRIAPRVVLVEMDRKSSFRDKLRQRIRRIRWRYQDFSYMKSIWPRPSELQIGGSFAPSEALRTTLMSSEIRVVIESGRVGRGSQSPQVTNVSWVVAAMPP
jgi:hypothetical protein